MTSTENNQQILDIIVQEGLLSEAASANVLKKAESELESVLTIIISDKLAEEEQLLSLVANKSGVKYNNLKDIDINQNILDFFPVRFVSHYTVMPLSLSEDSLVVAVSDPYDIYTIDDISSFLDISVKPVLASKHSILNAIHKYYGLGASTVHKLSEEKPRFETEQKQEEADEETTSIIFLVNTLIKEAIKSDATDVHLEPYEKGLRVRFRIDGVLEDVILPDEIVKFYPSIISRIKILSQLDIAEKRLPQDGRIQMNIDGTDLDLRVSTMPLVRGEGIHLRILRQNEFLDLESLGYMPDHMAILEEVIKKPNGIILVTGPTGSGKSTTLYACLDKINSHALKIITVEDPVEYNLERVNQIQVQPKIGLTFAEGLRHILRHDPDVLMVGEIRDSETAEIAMRAALTGHLVLSTLHTNDAAGTVTRLLDMDFEPFLISSSLECVLAQRLVRKLCKKCRKKIKFDSSSYKEEGLTKEFKHLTEIYEPVGCENCRSTGYKGRTGIYEIMSMTDTIRELILKRASSPEIKSQAIAEGMKTLIQDGLDKVALGITSIAELLRVIKEE